MSATGLLISRQAWSRVGTGSLGLAAADRDALGTTARLVAWPAENLPRLLAAVDGELADLDAQASRFRADSEISAVHAAGAGSYRISDGLAEAVGIALAAAAWTGGLSDPTVGSALVGIGYDRDFAAIKPSTAGTTPAVGPVAGWRAVRLNENELTVPAGVVLDLGATAKALGADRAAAAAYAAAGIGGVLVSLGGDVAVAGSPPAGGWPVLVADEHRQVREARNLGRRSRTAPRAERTAPLTPPPTADPAVAQQIRLARGGLATSSVTCRQWLRAGHLMHHIIDPRTGLPASGPWRTVSVAAASCAEANAASTAAIVAGEDAVGWLTAAGLPARLVGHDGRITCTDGWPEVDDGLVNASGTSALATWRDGSGR
jgi:thiamine biosynthesis lipoprotein ApbE